MATSFEWLAPRASWLRLARSLAELLDQRVKLPGLRLPIGLDPLVGLIPGIGDLISNALGALLLLIAAQCGVPKIVIVRMGVNTALNASIGMIPLVGDLFSLWFKSNLRNVAVLERHALVEGRTSTVGDWIFVLLVLLVVLIIVGVGFVGLVWLLHAAWAFVARS